MNNIRKTESAECEYTGQESEDAETCDATEVSQDSSKI